MKAPPEKVFSAHDRTVKRLSMMIETIPYAVITAGPGGAIVFCNSAAERIFGYSHEELIGLPLETLLPSGCREAHPGMLLTSPQPGCAPQRPVEAEGRRKDGTGFPIEYCLSSWHSDDGYFTCVIRDTARRRPAAIPPALPEDKAREYEHLLGLFGQVEFIKEELEKTIDCVGDMIVLTDGQGRIRRCNRTFKEFTGRSYSEVIGSDWEELFFGGRTGPEPGFGQVREFFHERSRRWFIVNYYPFVSAKECGTPGMAIMIHDSTELKKITRELEKKNSELEKAYSELKAAHTQILQQEKMASIGQLAAGVAHEINNPIGFILSNLGTLDKYVSRLVEFIDVQAGMIGTFETADLRGLDEKRRKLKLDHIIPDTKALIRESSEGAERVKSIVRDLKSFSRVDESGTVSADINAGIESTINIVWNELKYKATLKKEYGTIPPTKCNPGQLNQVFLNLLINAAQAIEKQGEITVKTWNGDGSIYISISDTGCGIPAEKIDRIFEPFFTTKEVGKGTGLGLSIAYDIVRKHKGEIRVESEQGKGTTFTLKIPVVE